MKKNKYISDFVTALLIGFTIDALFITFYAAIYTSLSSDIILKSALATLIISTASFIASFLFKSDKLSLLAATVIHYIIIGGPVVGSALYAGWIKNIKTVPSLLAVFTVIYVIIYLANYFSHKARIEEINKTIKEHK